VIQCGGRGTQRAGAPRWRETRERAMHAMKIVVLPECLQLSRQIDRVPEENDVTIRDVRKLGEPIETLREVLFREHERRARFGTDEATRLPPQSVWQLRFGQLRVSGLRRAEGRREYKCDVSQ